MLPENYDGGWLVGVWQTGFGGNNVYKSYHYLSSMIHEVSGSFMWSHICNQPVDGYISYIPIVITIYSHSNNI